MLRSLALGLALGMAFLAACVGNEHLDAPPLSIPLDEGGAGASSGAASSSGIPHDAGHETGANCAPNLTACGDTCEDLHSSKTACGRCGRACGPGSDCISGSCTAIQAVPTLQDIYALAATDTGVVVAHTPAENSSTVSICKHEEGCSLSTLVTIKSGMTNARTMTALDKTIYFDENGGDTSYVELCSVDGCPQAGPNQVQGVTNDQAGVVAASPTHVVWSRQGGDSSYFDSCSLPEGCNATNPVITRVRNENDHGAPNGYSSDPQHENDYPVTLMSVGAKTVFWNTGGTPQNSSQFLAYCSFASAPCNDGTLLDTGASNVVAMVHFNGTHFIATSHESRNDIIYAFSDETPTSTKPIANDVQGIAWIAADATGIYWANGKSGEILHCGNVTDGCTANETIATGQTGVKFVAVNSKYVFWATATKVFQVAK